MHTIISQKWPEAADHWWNTPCDANITDEMWNSCTFLCKNHDYFYCIADICSTNAGSLQNTKLLSLLQRFRAMHGQNIHFSSDQIVLGLKAPMQWLFEISQFGSLSRNARQGGRVGAGPEANCILQVRHINHLQPTELLRLSQPFNSLPFHQQVDPSMS